MSKTITDPFSSGTLENYYFFDRLLIRLTCYTASLLIKIIGRTIRFDDEEIGKIEKIESEGKAPIYAFWHDRILLSVYFLRNRFVIGMTSPSGDGEIIARTIQRCGWGAVRGSSSRDGAKGLIAMIRFTRKGFASGFAVDGPKGPRYQVKAGALMLSRKTANPILPILIECKSYWTLNSWDKFQIPKPFTLAKVFIGDPIYAVAVSPQVETEIEEYQNALDKLVEKGRNWRESLTG